MQHQYEITDGYTTIETGDSIHECLSVCVCTITGAEVWLHVDRESGELVLAERIDGEWYDLDLEYAEREYADVLYAVR